MFACTRIDPEPNPTNDCPDDNPPVIAFWLDAWYVAEPAIVDPTISVLAVPPRFELIPWVGPLSIDDVQVSVAVNAPEKVIDNPSTFNTWLTLL